MTTATDVSGLGNHGTYQGGVVCNLSIVPTETNRAARFDGSTGWVEVNAAVPEIQASPEWAMGVWAQVLTARGDLGLMTVNRSVADFNLALLQGSMATGVGYFELNMPDSSSNQLTTEPGTPHAVGDVVFVVANCGEGKQELYTNGALAAATAYTGTWPSSAATRFSIGQDFDSLTGTSAHFPGVLDEAFLVGRHLTAAEISDLYTAGVAGGGFHDAVMALSGLLGYWRLDLPCARRPSLGRIGFG